MITTGNLTGRLHTQIPDKCGRWVCQEFRGSFQKASHAGIMTVADQLTSLLMQSGDPLSDPRAAFRRDLKLCLDQYKADGMKSYL
jgi:hypothetical protein